MATKKISQRDFEHLAMLKVQKKEVEAEMNAIQEKILLYSFPKPKEEVQTKQGILKLRKRENVSVSDNNKLIKNSSITQQIFINSAKLAPSTIKKIVGETEFKQLIRKKILQCGENTEYYVLEAPKKNQEQQ